jgi:hypothetical protein
MSSQTEKAFAYAQKLADHRFWGYLTFKFEDGNIVHMRREENLKPSEMVIVPETNRSNHNESSSQQAV